MSEYSPGPWMVYDENEGFPWPRWCVANDAFFNPTEENDGTLFQVIVQYGTEDDAHLIAAAPKLLEELEGLIHSLWWCLDEPDVIEYHLDHATRVIAKARGEVEA